METTGEIFQRIIQIVAIVAVGGLLLFPVLAFPFWVWEKLENRKRFADVDALLDAQWKERVAALDLEFEELRRTLASTALSPLERNSPKASPLTGAGLNGRAPKFVMQGTHCWT